MLLPAVALSLALAALPDLRVRPPPAPALRLDMGDVVTERGTQAALIGTAVLLLVLEVAIVRERDRGHVVPTISQVLRDWGSQYGTLPWTAGVLSGHWWWNGSRWPDERSARRNALMLGGLTLGVLAWDVFDHRGGKRWRAPVLLVGGVLAGHRLWVQRR